MSTLITDPFRFRRFRRPPDFINQIPDRHRLTVGVDGQAGRPEAVSAGRSATSQRTNTCSMTSA